MMGKANAQAASECLMAARISESEDRCTSEGIVGYWAKTFTDIKQTVNKRFSFFIPLFLCTLIQVNLLEIKKRKQKLSLF
jgi:hypothetical protein